MKLFSELYKKEHILSKIDARLKMTTSLVILAMVISYRGYAFPLAIAVMSFSLCIMMNIPIRTFAFRFSEPVFIASIIVLLKLFFHGNDPIFSINIIGINISGYKEGLMDGLLIALRILGAVSVMAVMGFSTPFNEILAGLSWMRVPRGFVEILMFAYRYIFVLIEDAMVIYNAQKNRLGYSSIRQGMGSFGTLTGSLILKAFDHSHDISVAMIQRGFDGNIPLMNHKPFKSLEIAFSFILLSALGILWVI